MRKTIRQARKKAERFVAAVAVVVTTVPVLLTFLFCSFLFFSFYYRR